MGNAFTEPIGAPGNLSLFWMIDMYTSCTHQSVKNSILQPFPARGSSLRVIISTVAFGMSIALSMLVHRVILKCMFNKLVEFTITANELAS